jgi:glycosyltransferase involved in cell wall biosynthesis
MVQKGKFLQEAPVSAIARLCVDPALRYRLGDAARKKAMAEFDERIVIQQTLDVYRELV